MLGVKPGRENEYRETILSNKIIIIAVILVIMFVPVEIVLNGIKLVPVELSCGILFLSVLYFNHKGLYTFARYFIIIFAVVIVAFMTFMVGGGSNSEYVLIALMVSPLLLFKQKKHALLLVFFVGASFFIVRYFSDKAPALVEVPLTIKEQVRPVMVLMTMVLLFSQVYYFKKLNNKYQLELIESKKEVELKQKEVLDSIIYAKRIQTAILPSARIFKEQLPKSFVLYKPKDIVAGDFYWLESVGSTILFAAADCTGHGVPGAMVSVMCNNALNRSVREHKLLDPGKILNETRNILIKEFEKSDEEVKDGMDISLCALEQKTKVLHWSGANNPLWIIKENAMEVEEIKANKQPIGKYAEPKPFTTHEIQLEEGDTVYVFTDGFQDQFGGEKGKKYKASKMKELLLSIKHESMDRQQELINLAFEKWRGEIEQVDDVCIIGVRV